MWLTDLARLADPKYGLTVRFESGWKRRGATGGQQMKAVQGVLWHHTAGSRHGNNPSRNILINGRPGLTGPLCHINMPRDGTIRITGAGKANHAGTGKVPGVVRNGGNTRLIGIEMESAGTRPWDWTSAQLAAMPRLGAALSDIFGLSSSQHWAHYEYSDGGKIDPAGLPGAMPGLRSRIAAVRFSGIPIGGGAGVPQPSRDPARPWRTSPRVQGMSTAEVRGIQATLTDLGYDLGSYGVDGSYGDATGAAVKALQTGLGITSDGVYGPGTEKALMSKLDDIRKDLAAIKRTLEPGIAGKRTDGDLAGFIRKQIRPVARSLQPGIAGERTDGEAISAMRRFRNDVIAGVAAAQAAVLEAVQETGKAQGLTDAQVQAIATAAAEASARVSAEDVAGRLEVGVRDEG